MPHFEPKALTNIPLLSQHAVSNPDHQDTASSPTHPLRQHNSKHKDPQKARGAQPAIQYKRGDLVQELLVLPLRVVDFRRDIRDAWPWCARFIRVHRGDADKDGERGRSRLSGCGGGPGRESTRRPFTRRGGGFVALLPHGDPNGCGRKMKSGPFG